MQEEDIATKSTLEDIYLGRYSWQKHTSLERQPDYGADPLLRCDQPSCPPACPKCTVSSKQSTKRVPKAGKT